MAALPIILNILKITGIVLASILGFDKVASVAGLVDDIDSIKAAMGKESGVHEKSAGIEGAKDIVDVVSDIVKKD